MSGRIITVNTAIFTLTLITKGQVERISVKRTKQAKTKKVIDGRFEGNYNKKLNRNSVMDQRGLESKIH